MSPTASEALDLRPTRGLTAPGTSARLACCFAPGGGEVSGELRVVATDLLREVAEVRVETRRPEEGGAVEVELELPDTATRGYHLRARWTPHDGSAATTARGAVLVAEHWRDAPRMGFLSAFGPGESRPQRLADMAGFHLTVVQFYDWMYRHYQFLPPSETYRDGMGRECSLRTVRERIDAVHAHGMAALAYGAVYGAEREYAEAHPEQLLHDADGRPHALIDRFYITDPRPGPWRERLLAEYVATVRELDFDAIHMDQYGAPKRAFDAGGAPVDLRTSFPGLIDEAAARVRAVRRHAAVTFNAVNDWPSEAVAASDQAVVYIEVWPPHDRYRHLVELVHRARAASGGKQVVLAAYLEPFREGGAAAEEAAFLATAVIAAAGGHHLLLGEGDRVLRDPYYPNHGSLSPNGRARMRRLYDHTAALHAWLFDPDAVDRSRTFAHGENAELAIHGTVTTSEPAAGSVWTAVWEHGDGSLVIHLVNLMHLEEDAWNAPKPEPGQALEGLTLEIGAGFRAPRVTWLDPDEERGPLGLTCERSGSIGRCRLPPLALWATLVVEEEGSRETGARG